MSTSHKTAADFRKHLEASLQKHSSETGEGIQRLRRKVAFERLLARIFTQERPYFFLKGGYAMELRIARARATRDMDLTCLRRVSDAKEQMSELILQELQTLARINLNDHFFYHIGQPHGDIENAPYGGSRHDITAIIDNSPFVEFHLDVGGDFLIDDTEKVTVRSLLQFYGITDPVIHIITVEQQFAEKLHSYTLPREQINTRAKDLIDMILLLQQDERELKVFQNTLHRVFRARNNHPLPASLSKPPESWQKPFAAMAEECGISVSLDDGFRAVGEFYSAIFR